MNLHFYNNDGVPVFPLETSQGLPAFDNIVEADVVGLYTQSIEKTKTDIETILDTHESTGFTWENFMVPLDELGDYLHRLSSPVRHMRSVSSDCPVRSEKLREMSDALANIGTEYSAWVGSNARLYEALKAVGDLNLNDSQRREHDASMLSFRLTGAELPAEEQEHLAQLKSCITKLANKFRDNVVDATAAHTIHVETAEELDGLPEKVMKEAKRLAEAEELDGYLFTLQTPSYYPIMEYCTNRELRERVSKASATRASEIGPNAGEFDNTDIIADMLELKHEKARVLGYNNYAELSVATKSADSTESVMKFLTDLVDCSHDFAGDQADELKEYATSELGIAEVKPFDLAFASTALLEHKYDISNEEIREYFPSAHVVNGLFDIVHRLFNIEIERCTCVDGEPVQLPHPDANYYEVYRDDNLIASFYLDLYARKGKQGGAWMDDAFNPIETVNGLSHLPVAYLTCNFSSPTAEHDALLTHDEVVTLFHEFGHGLHLMLTQTSTGGTAGINGVPWDLVELPSQIMENWCWQPECIEILSSHYQTGESLPTDLLDKLISARNYGSALGIARQLEFSLFDFTLHRDYNKDTVALDVIKQVREAVCPFETAEYSRFPNTFNHIFGGGYAAGYYSYKWAEVMSADAFSVFEEEGIFNTETAAKFEALILSVGGGEDLMTNLTTFIGREPNAQALLRHSGLKD